MAENIICPVCGKRILPAGAGFPDEYADEYLSLSYAGEEEEEEAEEVESISEDCPVQRGWSMAVPFKVGLFRFLTVELSEQTFAPLTLVCDYHPLHRVISESLRLFAPGIEKLPQQSLIIWAEEVHSIKQVLPQVQGGSSEENKIFWLWYQVNQANQKEGESDTSSDE